jgi:hypothetical protein
MKRISRKMIYNIARLISEDVTEEPAESEEPEDNMEDFWERDDDGDDDGKSSAFWDFVGHGTHSPYLRNRKRSAGQFPWIVGQEIELMRTEKLTAQEMIDIIESEFDLSNYEGGAPVYSKEEIENFLNWWGAIIMRSEFDEHGGDMVFWFRNGSALWNLVNIAHVIAKEEAEHNGILVDHLSKLALWVQMYGEQTPNLILRSGRGSSTKPTNDGMANFRSRAAESGILMLSCEF